MCQLSRIFLGILLVTKLKRSIDLSGGRNEVKTGDQNKSLSALKVLRGGEQTAKERC